MPDRIIHLNALNLDLPVNDNVFFHDDGFVQDLNMHFAMTAARYGASRKEIEELLENTEILGRMRAFRNQGELHIYIGYYVDRSEIQQLQTRGHEETHVLYTLGALSALKDAMKEKFSLDINFEKVYHLTQDHYKLSEVSADIGGLFAVHQTFGRRKMIDYYKPLAAEYEYLDLAFDIYLEAMNGPKPSLLRWLPIPFRRNGV